MTDKYSDKASEEVANKEAVEKTVAETVTEEGIWTKLESLIKNREQLLLWLMVLTVLLIVPLKITSYGWYPGDDALRHSAHGVNEKSWDDVLVMKSDYTIDHNPGWHSILRFMHKNFSMDKEELLLFSIVGLYLLYNIIGLIVVKNPIAWLIALVFLVMGDYGSNFRFIIGRPLVFSAAVTLLLLALWSKPKGELKEGIVSIVTIIMLSLATWIHGSWYLFLLLPVAFFLSGKNRQSFMLLGCTLIGSLIGALLSCNFLEFLIFHSSIPLKIFTESVASKQLVTEFSPGHVSGVIVIFGILITLLWQKKCNGKLADLTSDPIFIFTVLCWLMSIMVIRFWIDWGKVGFTLWISMRIADLIKNSASLKNPRVRYVLALFAITSFMFVGIHDRGGRYSDSDPYIVPIDFNDPDLLDWKPGKDGIIYSNLMRTFFTHYFAYPDADWKYVLGFEAALMRDDDLAIFREIGSGDNSAFDLWIEKMRPQDRLITHAKYGGSDKIEWKRATKGYFIGRLLTSD